MPREVVSFRHIVLLYGECIEPKKRQLFILRLPTCLCYGRPHYYYAYTNACAVVKTRLRASFLVEENQSLKVKIVLVLVMKSLFE